MLLDTSVLVDIDRSAPRAAERSHRLDREGRHALSAVTVTELEYGALPRRARRAGRRPGTVSAITAAFDILPITAEVARRAAHLMSDLERRGKSLDDLHDLYIAATALQHDLAVLTTNLDHFQRIPGLQTVDWSAY